MNINRHKAAPVRVLGVLLAVACALLMGGAFIPASAAPHQSNGHANGQAHSGKATAPSGHTAGTDSTTTTHGNSTASSHQTKGTAGTSGDTTKPQPLSNADQNGGGANGKCPGGPYCSTRHGSASMNGNGNGKATGKPCAGCVGRADNKNPKGQYPNGSDHNNGYECDGNHGIGRSNPAHTSCTPAPTVTPTCSTQPTMPKCQHTTPPQNCSTQPGMPKCQHTSPPQNCTTKPGMPTCQHTSPPQNCTTKPTMPTCQHVSTPGTCSTQPTMPTCQHTTPPGTAGGGGTAGGPTGSVSVSSPHTVVTPHTAVSPPQAVSPTAATLPNTGGPSWTGIAAAMLLLASGLLLVRRHGRSRATR